MHGQERRESPRFPFVVAVKQQSDETMVLCQSENISHSGMSLRLPAETVALHSKRVGLQFTLPGSEILLELKARVVRFRKGARFARAGVRFEGVETRFHHLLARYLPG